MTGLGIGLENLVGLIAIFEGNENTVSCFSWNNLISKCFISAF